MPDITRYDVTENATAAVRATVREKYGQAALRVVEGAGDSCCGPVNSCCGGAAFDGTVDPITANLYINGETDVLPEAAVLASLGCGNPTALAELREGEVVLDLGSGGGIDVLLSARRVGPTGKAYGLDMTDEMLALARSNAEQAGATNVEFLKGHIEAIPLPDHSVDVIISNCVINLSGDKPSVLAEAFRVLKPGGRFAVSDVVVRGAVPEAVKHSMELWIGCIAGALEESEFQRLLTQAGFTNVDIEPTRIYHVDDARTFLSGAGLDVDALAPEIEGRFMSAFVRAAKPGSSDASVVPDATPFHPDSGVRPLHVLFLCTRNSARSQLAEAVMRHKVDRLMAGRFVVASAGSDPGTAVHPMALNVLAKRGINWRGHPKSVSDVADQTWDLIITVCDRAKETCPTVPGQPVYAHWGMDDPADVDGEDAQVRAFGETLTYVSRRIDFLLALPVETLERAALRTRVQSIADEVPVPRRVTSELS